MNLIVDIGNTNAKLAVFQGDEIIHFETVDYADVIATLGKYLVEFDITRSILSNVGAKIEGLDVFLQNNFYHINLDSRTSLPIEINYDTPETLGVDRMALAVASFYKSEGKNSLVIDMGSCITYDFTTSKGEYQGGAISPGLNMRFKAMHNFTESLPLVSIRESQSIIGKNTEMSLVNGVVNGITAEIDSYIETLIKEFGDISVFISGGDHRFFVNKLKNSIFADQKILLRGLNRILNYNFEKKK
jgi:type III pantothenate kinase